MDKKALEYAKELATLLFSKEEILTMINENNEVETINDAIKIGELQSLYEFRKSIFTMVQNGSAPAQNKWHELLREYEQKKNR